jgi:hypothetical protein
MMLQKLHSLHLSSSISGLSGANGRLVAVDGPSRRIHSVVVDNDQLVRIATVKMGGARPWQRTFSIIEDANGYMIVNNPSCALSYSGELSAFSTPDAPIQLYTNPELRLINELGGPGEARGLCFTGEQPTLIAHLITRAHARDEMRVEAYWFDLSSDTRHVAGERLVGRNIASSETNCLFSLKQELETFVHEASPPFRTRDLAFISYVRPDGVAISRNGRFVAAVEFDYFHRLVVIDAATCTQRLFVRYSGETQRPEHALNHGLAGFDAAEGIYVPAPRGVIVRFDLMSSRRDNFQAHSAEVTGLVTFPDQNLLVSADAEGTITLWRCDVPRIAMPDVPNQLSTTPFLASKHVTRIIDLSEEEIVYGP